MNHNYEPRVGTAAIIMRNNKVLLGLRQGSHAAGLWALPGGHLEYEEKFEECIRREILEETGMTVDIKTIAPASFTNDLFPNESRLEKRHYVTLYFFCEAAGDPQILEPRKCKEWQWFDPSDLPQNTWPRLSERLKKMLTVSSPLA